MKRSVVYAVLIGLLLAVGVGVYAADKTVVEFWTTDNEPDRVAAYEAVAARFMADNPGIEVKIVPVDEASVSQRISTARAANQLPDIVRMGIERVASFSADGILDENAAEAVINSIGK
ncbi:MAG: sugar ABC transporter substrate-binding protein, partial [Chloroflexi bacterium]